MLPRAAGNTTHFAMADRPWGALRVTWPQSYEQRQKVLIPPRWIRLLEV